MPDDRIADPRTALALERTFLAWVRTALALMGFGFVVARFGLFLREVARARGVMIPQGVGTSTILGIALVALGVSVGGYSAFRFRRALTALRRNESPEVHSAAVPISIALVLCGIGVATVIYLLTVA